VSAEGRRRGRVEGSPVRVAVVVVVVLVVVLVVLI